MSSHIATLRQYARDTGPFRVNKQGATDLAAATKAMIQLHKDVETSLAMLAAEGLEDAPVSGFLRSALARSQGA